MINRTLIRIKVLQILYSFYISGGKYSKVAANNLTLALDKCYQLYLLMVAAPYFIKDIAQKRLDAELAKRSKDEQLIDFLTAIVQSKFVRVIEEDSVFLNEILSYLPSNNHMLEYFAYILNELTENIQEWHPYLSKDDIEEERKFWKKVYKDYIVENDEFYSILQDSNIFWNDDISIVMSFVLKVCNSLTDSKSLKDQIRPKYNSCQDEEFGTKLIVEAIENDQEYRAILSNYFINWDSERVAEMDFLILQLALTEAINFPTIATRVTINEYLNLVKYYSSPSNTTYINGILHQVVSDLKEEGRIIGE